MLVSMRSWRQRALFLLLLVAIATMLLGPIISNSFVPNVLDYVNHFHTIIQANMALHEGQFPLRIAPLEQLGWRYPLFQFYSPTSYTFAALIYQVSGFSSPFIVYKITLGCFLVIGGIYMFRLADWFVKSKPAALLASIVYLTAPYYIILIDHLAAFNEAIALGILPAALYYTLKCYHHGLTKKLFLQVGLVWYLLATTHLITFLYSLMFVAVFLLLNTCQNLNRWKNVCCVGLVAGFSCCLAMWYLAPIALISKYLWVGGAVGNQFAHFALFNQYSPAFSTLLSPAVGISPKAQPLSGDVGDLIATYHPSIGIPILIAVVVAIYMKLNQYISDKKRFDYYFSALLILFLIAFLMIWSPIKFWAWLPSVFMVIQYSWRLLGQVMWIGAILFAWVICCLFKNKLDARHIVLGVLLVVLASSAWLTGSKYLYYSPSSELLKTPQLVWNVQAYLINSQLYFKSIDKVDSVLLPYSVKDTSDEQLTFQLDGHIPFPWHLIKSAVAPVLIIEGHQFRQAKINSQQLTAIINGVTVGTFEPKSGSFRWVLPLNAVRRTIKDDQTPILLALRLLPIKKETQFKVTFKKIILDGLLKPSETIGVDEVKSHCKQEKTSTICQVTSLKNTRLLELPILYYPNMLALTLNGHSVPYQSVLYEDKVIVGIKPVPGKLNTVVIQFRGFLWANRVSEVAWSFWGLFFVWMVGQLLFKRRTSIGKC